MNSITFMNKPNKILIKQELDFNNKILMKNLELIKDKSITKEIKLSIFLNDKRISYKQTIELYNNLLQEKEQEQEKIFEAERKKKNPFTVDNFGRNTWIQIPNDKYLVTGTDRENKRFSMTFDNWHHVNGINLWKGSKWLLRDNKKYLITRIFN